MGFWCLEVAEAAMSFTSELLEALVRVPADFHVTKTVHQRDPESSEAACRLELQRARCN